MLWPEGRENRVQNKPKKSFSPVFLPANILSSLSLSLSLSLSPAASSALEDLTETFLLHQQTASQPHHEPKSSPAIGTTTARSSLFSLQILFFCIFFFLPSHKQPTLPPTSTSTSTSTIGFTTIIAINPAPHQWQSSHHDLLSLLLLAFLSPLQCFLLPPTADCSHHHLNRHHLSHQPNHLITTETPTPGNFLLPALPPPSSLRPLHAEFIPACSDRIINWSLGRASFGLAQMAGYDPTLF